MEKQMKKSVVVLIGIIYIASIALVSFFGLKFKVFEEVVYTESVELLNEDIKPGNDDFDYYVAIRPDENGERRYQIRYRVHPDNATDQSVSFALAPTSSDDDGEVSGVSIDKNGVVTFEGDGIASVIVHVVANNGSGEAASVSLAIFAYAN